MKRWPIWIAISVVTFVVDWWHGQLRYERSVQVDWYVSNEGHDIPFCGKSDGYWACKTVDYAMKQIPDRVVHQTNIIGVVPKQDAGIWPRFDPMSPPQAPMEGPI